jgi:hypothetical protein
MQNVGFCVNIFKDPSNKRFYVKNMSAHGSHLGWRSWSSDTILKVYYPRTIHAMFGLNWPTGFRGEDLKQTRHGWSLGGQFSKLCPVNLTSIQDGHLQRTYCSFKEIFFKHFSHRVLCYKYVCWWWPSWMEVRVT